MRNKPKVVWLQAMACNGNTQSFLSSNAQRFEQFVASFELLYHPGITYHTTLQNILTNEEQIDFLLIEGALSNERAFFSMHNKSLKEILKVLLKRTTHLIAIGSCASFGGVHTQFKEAKNECLKDFLHTHKLVFKPAIIHLSGCPVHPEWILQTLFMLKKFNHIQLDEQQRPIELYANLAHHGCTRNEYFEWKVQSQSFGVKEGCLFYDHGCQAPMTHSSCNKILWNDTSSKTRVGMPCIGCTEVDFPKENLFETKKNMGIPAMVPLGISKRAYLSITGVAKTFTIPRLNQKLMNNENH
jgi:hydrogenase small subunit